MVISASVPISRETTTHLGRVVALTHWLASALGFQESVKPYHCITILSFGFMFMPSSSSRDNDNHTSFSDDKDSRSSMI
ncbi:hypothetical protein Tco_1225231 [Tanacetum coccineum]